MKSMNIVLVESGNPVDLTKANTVEVILQHRHHENHSNYNKDEQKRFCPESETQSFVMKCTLQEIPFLIEAVWEVNQYILNYEEYEYTLPATDEKNRIPVNKVIKNKLKHFSIPVVKEKGRKVGFAHVYLESIKFINEKGETSEVKWL